LTYLKHSSTIKNYFSKEGNRKKKIELNIII
jgi:hypothetical protein